MQPLAFAVEHVIPVHVCCAEGLEAFAATFAQTVRRVLCDRRGWRRAGLRFCFPVHDAGASGRGFRVELCTNAQVERECGALAPVPMSCAFVDGRGRCLINLTRWMGGSAASGLALEEYRAYVINHEVGHLLGERHAPCAAAGAPAPVMLQQTLGTRGCAPNPWPLREELERVARRWRRL